MASTWEIEELPPSDTEENPPRETELLDIESSPNELPPQNDEVLQTIDRVELLSMSMGSRHWRDVFWIGSFLLHIVIVGCGLGLVGVKIFRNKDRLHIDEFTRMYLENQSGFTQDYWSLYAICGAVSIAIGWGWLFFLGSLSTQMMKLSFHVVTAYLTALSVLSFWDKHVQSGVALAVGAGLHFMYVMSVIEYRLPYTMLVLQSAVKMLLKLPEVIRAACTFTLVMLIWLVLWTFGASGVVASGIGDSGRWWLLVVFLVSLIWAGAVLCNILHVVASGMVYLVLSHGGREAATMPPTPLLKSLHYATTTSFGSICYGSLFTAALRTLRSEIRGFRSKFVNNECLLCWIDCVFGMVETLVRCFNKYAYVQVAVYGKGFNKSASDAWELLQSTGVEALISFDCSGVVLLMVTLVGGLITGTCAVVLTRIKHPELDMMMGYTATVMGMVLIGLATVVVESAVTTIYICFAKDPLLIQRWDPELFKEMSELLHQRLKHRT